MAKKLGQVFTPSNIVDLILDDVGYTEGNIIDKKIIEPSFGKGAFLIKIVERLIQECRRQSMSNKDIINQLESSIYGIEIDKRLYDYTLRILNEYAAGYGLYDIHWNLYCQDALDWNEFDCFDYVVGNPPYVRIHDLSLEIREKLSNWKFSKGNTDLYVLFFELGLKMLNHTGVLGYITPNSYFKNTSQGPFRKYLLDDNLVAKIRDYGPEKIFEVNTYTAITILSKNKSSFFFPFLYMASPSYKTTYDENDFIENGLFTEKPWIFTSKENKALLDEIKNKPTRLSDIVEVQFGFATNRDDVFIVKEIFPSQKDNCISFNGFDVEAELIHKIVKASAYHGKHHWTLFPYFKDDGKYKVIPEDILSEKYPMAYHYLLFHKDVLLKRDMEKNSLWYQFGRSQGLRNCGKSKLVVSPLLSPHNHDVNVFEFDENVFVYAGIFITPIGDVPLSRIKDVLQSKLFYTYAFCHGKDRNGGYKEFNSKIIKNFRID